MTPRLSTTQAGCSSMRNIAVSPYGTACSGGYSSSSLVHKTQNSHQKCRQLLLLREHQKKTSYFFSAAGHPFPLCSAELQ